MPLFIDISPQEENRRDQQCTAKHEINQVQHNIIDHMLDPTHLMPRRSDVLHNACIVTGVHSDADDPLGVLELATTREELAVSELEGNVDVILVINIHESFHIREVPVRLININSPRTRAQPMHIKPTEIRDAVWDIPATQTLLALESGSLDECAAVLLRGCNDYEIRWEGFHVTDQDVVPDLDVSPWYLLRLTILAFNLNSLLCI